MEIVHFESNLMEARKDAASRGVRQTNSQSYPQKMGVVFTASFAVNRSKT